MRLRNKVSIVTGGGAGIGKATALLFAEEGAKVVVADIDPGSGESTVAQIREKGGEAIFVQADISEEAQAKNITDETIRTFRRIDILINNAATFVLKGLGASVDEWKHSLHVNIIGTASCSK